MNEDANPEARIKAIIALTQVQTGATEVHERYSLLIMGFVGALAGYLFGSEGSSVSSGLEWSAAVLLVSSLACSVPAFWLGHMTAMMRKGIQSSERLEKNLQGLDLETQLEAMDAAGRWMYGKLPRMDRFVGKLFMDSDKPLPDRIEAVCGRIVALGIWQSWLMRLQLLFAVGATIALVLARF